MQKQVPKDQNWNKCHTKQWFVLFNSMILPLQVQMWLEKMFAGDDVPEFELNASNITLLYNLMKCNEQADKDTQVLVEDYQLKAEEYNIEGMFNYFDLYIKI